MLEEFSEQQKIGRFRFVELQTFEVRYFCICICVSRLKDLSLISMLAFCMANGAFDFHQRPNMLRLTLIFQGIFG